VPVLSEGVWHIPANLPERGQAYDTERGGAVSIELSCHLSIDQQKRALGATWLDQQLVTPAPDVGALGFGGEVRTALQVRKEFLVESGFAQKHNEQIIAPRDLLAQLRQHDIDNTGRELQAETGLLYRPAQPGQRISGTYRRSVQLASGRFALLDDEIGFSLVPWRPIVERALGKAVSAVVRGDVVSWQLGRDLSIGVG